VTMKFHLTPRPRKRHVLIGGDPALDFINTLDWRFRSKGPEEFLTSHARLVEFARATTKPPRWGSYDRQYPMSREEARRALLDAWKVRESLAEMCYAAVDGREAIFSDGNWYPFHEARSRGITNWISNEISYIQHEWPGEQGMKHGAELPLWMITLQVSKFLKSPDFAKIKACANAECRRLFLDRSVNQRRRWCKMSRCGSRAKAQTFNAK